MKPTGFFALVMGLILTLASCSNKTEQYEKLEADHAALQQQVEEKNRLVSELLITLASIEKNLSLIKAKEELIDAGSISTDEVPPDVQLRVMREINNVAAVLRENYNRLASLKEELRRSGVKMDAFRQTVMALNEAILAKEDQIDTLKRHLVEMNFEVDELEYLVSSLETVDSIKQDIIEGQKADLNRAWLAIGNEKELIEKGVVEKTGGILGIGSTLRLRDDPNEKLFSEVDVSNFGSVAFRGKKPRVVTPHPQDSYLLKQSDTDNQLSIADPGEFWSTSRVLVLVTK